MCRVIKLIFLAQIISSMAMLLASNPTRAADQSEIRLFARQKKANGDANSQIIKPYSQISIAKPIQLSAIKQADDFSAQNYLHGVMQREQGQSFYWLDGKLLDIQQTQLSQDKPVLMCDKQILHCVANAVRLIKQEAP